MPRVLTKEEVLSSAGCGWEETIWIEEDMPLRFAERTLYEVAWLHKDFITKAGYGQIDEYYGVFCPPSHEEFENYRDENDPSTYVMIAGHRFWDSKPTMAEMRNTAWKEA